MGGGKESIDQFMNSKEVVVVAQDLLEPEQRGARGSRARSERRSTKAGILYR